MTGDFGPWRTRVKRTGVYSWRCLSSGGGWAVQQIGRRAAESRRCCQSTSLISELQILVRHVKTRMWCIGSLGEEVAGNHGAGTR